MGFPVAVLPVGAPVERVKRYEKGLVLKNEQPENIVEEMISCGKLGENEFPVENRKILFVGEEISFASRYRVEHFREQLILNGYASKFIQMDQTEQENIEEYTAVVMYRCSKLMEAEMLVNRAKAAGIPVYYDVDDLVFDYENLRAAFPEGKRVQRFPHNHRPYPRMYGILRRIFHIHGNPGW